VFISEPVVESADGAPLAEPAPIAVVETAPVPETEPQSAAGPFIGAQPVTQQPQVDGPSSEPVFVSNPVVESVPDKVG